MKFGQIALAEDRGEHAAYFVFLGDRSNPALLLKAGSRCRAETTPELLGIARLKIHPGKREESNPALSPALLPEQPPRKQTHRFAP